MLEIQLATSYEQDRSYTDSPEEILLTAIEHPALKTDRLAHGFFTKINKSTKTSCKTLDFRFSQQETSDIILRNRARAATWLGGPDNGLIVPNQCHSNNILCLPRGALPCETDLQGAVDGLVTNRADIILGIITADCGPILLADSKAGVIGAVHAGWKGAQKNIIGNAIVEMIKMGAKIEQITAILGPTISQESYEVTAGFRDSFLDQEPSGTPFFIPSQRSDHFLFDLPEYIITALKQKKIGIVDQLGEDTYKNVERFHSYRRATHFGKKSYGGQLSAIRLKY